MKQKIVFTLIATLVLKMGLFSIAADGQPMIELVSQKGAAYYYEAAVHRSPKIQQAAEAVGSECEAMMESVYAAAVRHLNSSRRTSVQQLRGAINVALSREKETSWDLMILQLDQGEKPAWFVGFTCALSITEAYSTFRIFKAFGGQYQQVVVSGQYPALKRFDKLEIPIDHAGLRAQLLRSSDSKDRTYIFTDWVRAGMSPAPGSMFLWEWDGQQLRLIWQFIGFQYGTVKVVDHLVLLNRPEVPPEGLDPSSARQARRYVEVYRLKNRKLLKDGLLNRELAEKYLREGAVNANDPDSLMNLAPSLWEVDKEGAVRLYEQVVTLDPQRPLPYMSLSMLYEELGQFGKAAEYMRRLGSLVGGLSEEGERRIEELQRKAAEQRQP